jgi:beta-galactosidase
MKAYGFNAIRTSHNPPSPQFLDACDRYGVLVMDEAFDMWERAKNPNDYHLYFDDWWQRDLEAMVLRDRNHPSVILWSIGNEINERAEPSGVAICEKMIPVIRQLDTTRPITEGICGFWDHPGKKWADTAPGFAPLDVCGYNYQRQQYVSDHNQFPNRIMVGTESYPRDIYDNWQSVTAHPWVIGDFEWTAWDYLGETGVGSAVLDGERANRFPWFNAFCGDIDLCGFKKPGLYYREVVWGNSKLNLVVHAPISEGRRERVSGWGWPDERQSWTWPGAEGKTIDVVVYSSCPSVRLELDGKAIATNSVNKMIARFKVPYQPGELRAIGLTDGKPVASASLRTAGEASKIRLTADRSTIRAGRGDLSYVTVEVVDRNGNVVPNAALPIRFTVTGAGELAATGSTAPNDASSFHLPARKTYQGRCLAILRPQGVSGKISLKAEADGLKSATVVVKTR